MSKKIDKLLIFINFNYTFSCLIIIHLACNDHKGARKVHNEGHSLIQDYDRYDGSSVLERKYKLFAITDPT